MKVLNHLEVADLTEGVVVSDSTGDLSTPDVFETDGTPNSVQNLLNLQAGTNVTLTDSGTGTVTIDATDTTVALQVNGTPNVDQTLLNLKSGTNITLTDDGVGGVTIDATSATPVNFETNGTPNSDQTILNLVAGTGITLTESAGSVTVDSTVSSGPWSETSDTIFQTDPLKRVLMGGAADSTDAQVNTRGVQRIANSIVTAVGDYNDTFHLSQDFGGDVSYYSPVTGFFVWFDTGSTTWILNDTLGVIGSDYFQSPTSAINDTYVGNGAYTAQTTVVTLTTDVLALDVQGYAQVTAPTSFATVMGDITGDPRGNRAFDVQSHRVSATQVASGDHAVASGLSNTASGYYSVAFGDNNIASGSVAVSFGTSNTASGTDSTAFGYGNTASNTNAIAFGWQNQATGGSSTASGYYNIASGPESVAIGRNNSVTTTGGTAMGIGNIVSTSAYGFAFGQTNTASGSISYAFGGNNLASGALASAFGRSNEASNTYASAFGFGNTASGVGSSAFGGSNTASADYASAFGYGVNNSTANSTEVGRGDNGKARFSTAGMKLLTEGQGIYIKEGTDATMGLATLSSGTVVVSTTKVTANSRIFLTAQTLGTVTLGQGLAVSARTAGTSFTILSCSAIDTSTVSWIIFEPS